MNVRLLSTKFPVYSKLRALITSAPQPKGEMMILF